MYTHNPKVAWLTVNRRCNFRCRWCYAGGTEYRPEDEMSLEFATTLTRIAKEAGVETLLVIGGEPTLWSHLVDFNGYCATLGLTTVLVTNGARFASEQFRERYLSHPNSMVGLSLKGANPTQLAEVTGASNFAMVERGITWALRNLRASVNITYNSFAYGRLVEMVRFVIGCGARSVKIEFCSTAFSKGRPLSEFMVAPAALVEDIVRSYPELMRLTEGRITFDMMVPFCIWPEDFIRELYEKGRLLSVCHVHKRRGIIFDGAGRVLMCNALFDFPLGQYGRDFADGASLVAWLNEPKIRRLYDRIGCYPSVACKTCSWYAECGGGCPLRWAIYRPDEVVRPVKIRLDTKKEECDGNTT